MNLQRLRQLGFDRSHHIPFTKHYSVKCSQCEALVVNGVPTHERSCPNATKECKGCNAELPMNGPAYCKDCQ